MKKCRPCRRLGWAARPASDARRRSFRQGCLDVLFPREEDAVTDGRLIVKSPPPSSGVSFFQTLGDLPQVVGIVGFVGLRLQRRGQILLNVKGVLGVVVRQVSIKWMLCDVEFVRQEGTDAAQLEDALPAVQHGQLVLAHKLFATMSSDEFKS